MSTYHVYIVTNKKYGTLYIGVTSNLIERIYQHKSKLFKGFSAKYNLDKLVYCESFNDIRDAIECEKRMKHFLRQEKIDLINLFNPEWRDLYKDII